MPSRPRTFDDLTVRVARSIWIERLSDQYQRKVWSDIYRRRRISSTVDEMLWNTRMDVSELRKATAIHRIAEQLRTLEQSSMLRIVFGEQGKRWVYFQRQEKVNLNGIDLFAAPDIAVFHQDKWTLIRIRFRTSKWLPTIDLEHRLMAHWAVQQTGFPSSAGEYRIRELAWSRGIWREQRIEFDEKRMNEALDLLLHDVQEMRWTQRMALADPSLGILPLAASERSCRTCFHRESCPAKTGLHEAKERQREYLTTLNSKSRNKVSKH
ncbi:MAG: hypothetical protein L7S48_04835 [Candidatus Poseidonia sp.]|nr:hypothetical protein [Poseidonia sp.]